MLVDTHCHLNFDRFKKTINDVIREANDLRVEKIVVTGTDVESSKRAIQLSELHVSLYAAVGIHPHHGAKFVEKQKDDAIQELHQIEEMVINEKVVAIGEIGLDRHIYRETKYEHYEISEKFWELQELLFAAQLQLAVETKKPAIIHNREATEDLLRFLSEHWDADLESRLVFHCCEPDKRLLHFAKQHHIFMGIDGDITYDKAKQEFVKEIPAELLLLETDAPFLLPEPLRSERKFPNVPKNIQLIAKFVAGLRDVQVSELAKQTTENSYAVFKFT